MSNKRKQRTPGEVLGGAILGQRGVMTRDETALALGISTRTLMDKIKAGVLPLKPVVWSSYRTLFLRADVESVLSGQRRAGRRVA